MKRSVLTAEQSNWLAQTIERNRRFAGMRMMADEGGEGGDAAADADKGKESDAEKALDKGASGDDFKSEESKARVMADLASEREARKALKAELDSMKDVFAKAAGIEVKEGDKNEDVLTAVQQEVAAMRQEAAVLRLANTHKITDEGDLTILASATDAEQMKKLAERLAPKEQDSDATSRRPRPDRTQAGGKEGTQNQRPGSVREVQEQRMADRAAKTKTNSNV